MSETRTYRGGSLEELLPRIRAELGDDAVVVRQREGLTGGVAGFFQKRTVEIEARRGEVAPASTVEWFAGDPEEDAVVTPSPRFTTVPDEEPQPVAITPEEEQAARAFAAATARPATADPAGPADAGAPAAWSGTAPAPKAHPFSAYLNAAGAPDPAPSPAANGVPEGVPSARAGDAFTNAEELMRDALAARAQTASEPIVTSPQVDAIPVPERPAPPQAQAPPPPPPPEPEPEPEPEPAPPAPIPIRQPAPEPIHEPPPAASAWDPPSAVSPVAAVPQSDAAKPHVVAQAGGRPQTARHLIATLSTRGLDPVLAGTIVDDALLHRLPLEPVATLPHAVAAQLAARIPVATLSGPAARTLVLAGAAGSGAPRLVAGIAGAYASRTTVEVACIALRTPDGGRALAAALAPLGVPVHAAGDGAEAARHAAALGDALVLVDTPPVTPDDAARLASDLAALGPHELHLALGPGGGPSAAALMQALRPQRLAIGDPSDPLHLGAVLQAAIDSGCPLTFVASTAAAGRPDLAVHPADAGALARALTA